MTNRTRVQNVERSCTRVMRVRPVRLVAAGVTTRQEAGEHGGAEGAHEWLMPHLKSWNVGGL